MIRIKERKFALRYQYEHRKDILKKAFNVYDNTFLDFKRFDSFVDRMKSRMIDNKQVDNELHELVHDFTQKQQ